MNRLLIVGLGNPGQNYEKTRHNCGFLAARYYAEHNNFPEFQLDKRFDSLISEKEHVLIALPQTFMNTSGLAVKKIRDYYKIETQNIVIIHDEIDLPLGSYKKSQDKSSAGHKGVQSTIDLLGTKDFIRYRLGIAPATPNQKVKAEEIVLKKLTKKELEIVNEVIKNVAADIATTLVPTI